MCRYINFNMHFSDYLSGQNWLNKRTNFDNFVSIIALSEGGGTVVGGDNMPAPS